MKTSIITVLFATFMLAGCGGGPAENALALLHHECIAGKKASCTAAGLHEQVFSDDAAVAASIDTALRRAVDAGIAIRAKAQPRHYALGSRSPS